LTDLKPARNNPHASGIKKPVYLAFFMPCRNHPRFKSSLFAVLVMSNISQVQKIINFLQDQPLTRFSAREIAKDIIEKYPDDYLEKRENPQLLLK
jgi:hypothetical protein